MLEKTCSPGILGFEMEKKIFEAENFRKCSLCPPLAHVKSPKVSPERNILFFDKIQNGRQAPC